MDNERRDRRETLELAGMYLPLRRCVGGHIVHGGYVCPWCNSDQPTGREGYCRKEGVHGDMAHTDDLPKRNGGWSVRK